MSRWICNALEPSWRFILRPIERTDDLNRGRCRSVFESNMREEFMQSGAKIKSRYKDKPIMQTEKSIKILNYTRPQWKRAAWKYTFSLNFKQQQYFISFSSFSTEIDESLMILSINKLLSGCEKCWPFFHLCPKNKKFLRFINVKLW